MPKGNGGTQMWCPQCEEIHTCKAIPAAKVTDDPKDYGQRWHYPKHQDVQFFQRGRVCLSCGHRFVTSECDRQFLSELIELRNALADVRSNAESYISESRGASESLRNLHNSLLVLKALRLYRDGKGGDAQ